jgi:hypothetical protein
MKVVKAGVVVNAGRTKYRPAFAKKPEGGP